MGLMVSHLSFEWVQDALNYRSKQKYRQPDHDGTGRGSEEDENSAATCCMDLWEKHLKLGGGFFFLIFTPTWGDDAIWLLFVQTGWTQQLVIKDERNT